MNVQRFDCKTNQEWRAERAHSIGASAVGILIGENPWTTPMELAQKMRAELNGEFDYTMPPDGQFGPGNMPNGMPGGSPPQGGPGGF